MLSPYAIGIETEFTPFLLRDEKNVEDDDFYRRFWLHFLDYVQRNVPVAPGIMTDECHIESTDWNEHPTILFPQCGGKLYLDSLNQSISLCYPEWCTPECSSALEATKYLTSCDNVMASAFKSADEQIAKPQRVSASLYRITNVPGDDKVKGMHENYAVNPSLHETLTDRNHPITEKLFLPFIATRTLFAGSGDLDQTGEFLLSRRALLTNRYTHIANLREAGRGVLDNRSESRSSTSKRLHVVSGDILSYRPANLLRIGSMSLLLRYLDYMQQQGREPISVYDQDDPFSLFNSAAHWISADSYTKSFLCKIQKNIAQEIRNHQTELGLSPGEIRLLALWLRVLDQLEDDHTQLSTEIEWVAKDTLLRQAKDNNSNFNHDQQLEALLLFHSIYPNFYPPYVNDNDSSSRFNKFGVVPYALTEKSTNPRAKVRGEYIQEMHSGGLRVRVNWDTIQVFGLRDQVSVFVFEDINSDVPIPLDTYIQNIQSDGTRTVNLTLLSLLLDRAEIQKDKDAAASDYVRAFNFSVLLKDDQSANRIGNKLHNLKKFQEAANCYEYAFSVDEKNSVYCCNLAGALLEQSKWQDAILYAKQAKQLGIDESWVYVRLVKYLIDEAKSSFYRNDINTTSQIVTDALELAQNVYVINNIGKECFQHGNYSDAERCFRRAIDLEPTDDVYKKNLASTLEARANEQIRREREAKEAEQRRIDEAARKAKAEKDKQERRRREVREKILRVCSFVAGCFLLLWIASAASRWYKRSREANAESKIVTTQPNSTDSEVKNQNSQPTDRSSENKQDNKKTQYRPPVVSLPPARIEFSSGGFQRIANTKFSIKREATDPRSITLNLKGKGITEATIKCVDENMGMSVFAAETLRRYPYRWKWDVYGPRFTITVSYKQNGRKRRRIIKQSYRVVSDN